MIHTIHKSFINDFLSNIQDLYEERIKTRNQVQHDEGKMNRAMLGHKLQKA